MLAKVHQLTGQVANTSTGVLVHAEGAHAAIEAFCRDLREKAPPLSHITEISVQATTGGHYRGFSIVQSRAGGHRFTLISPDTAVCDDCIQELFDPQDRRYGYPFINCTNCGPRYTIIEDIPYDRPKTSMRDFNMCPQCRREYDDPENRRFHAQPNACSVCGPKISLHAGNGEEIHTPDMIGTCVSLLKEGRILAVKGLGGFHLAVDAENERAVKKLRERKQREEKPLAVMAYDLKRIRRFALKNDLTALVMTSGNLSEEPIAIENADAFTRLKGIADYFLMHNRGIYLRSDDSVVKHAAGAPRFFRRSRGYVPVPVFLSKKVRPVLACGAALKNTVCLTKDTFAFLSQHVGDLENLATYAFFKKTIAHLQRILSIHPKVIAHDMHPDYLNTQYALEQADMEKVAVQHHHAHVVSCMAENQVSEPVIGLSFDGTGYGSDGNIWGGEVLLARYTGFERLAHLSYVAMPGSAAAIHEPWRMAVSYLYRTFGEDLFGLDLPLIRRIGEKKIRFMVAMIEKGINAPKTSSLGRLFDAVAALLDIGDRVAFEGQAAMALEMAADSAVEATYSFDLKSESVLKIEPQGIIEGVVQDIRAGVGVFRISAKFHATLIHLFESVCTRLKRETGLHRVALSGGVFQNTILLTGLVDRLTKSGFQVLTHEKVPTNDGGIALGQAVIADAAGR
ncbi:MAG: carbamoyltransferase HypF [Deltaproteobacteria bacterium]